MADVWGRLHRAGGGLPGDAQGPAQRTSRRAWPAPNLDRAPVVAITGQLARSLLHKESTGPSTSSRRSALSRSGTRSRDGRRRPEVVRARRSRSPRRRSPGRATWSPPRTWPMRLPRASPARRPAPPPLPRPAVACPRGGHPEPGGTPPDPRGEWRDPGPRREGTARPGRARAGPGRDDLGQGRLACRPSAHGHDRGTRLRGHRTCRLPQADVRIVAVGYETVEYGPVRWNPAGHARLVHIDFTAAEVDARYQPEVEVVADVREALELLAPSSPCARSARRRSGPRPLIGVRTPTRCSPRGS